VFCFTTGIKAAHGAVVIPATRKAILEDLLAFETTGSITFEGFLIEEKNALHLCNASTSIRAVWNIKLPFIVKLKRSSSKVRSDHVLRDFISGNRSHRISLLQHPVEAKRIIGYCRCLSI